MVLFLKKKERKKKDRCVLPLLFVKSDSSLKEGNGQMFILAYAAIKRLRNKETVTSSRKHGKVYFSFLSDLRFQAAYRRIVFQQLSKEFLVWTNLLIRQLLIFVCLCFSLQIRHTFSAASKSWSRRWRQPMSK